MLLGKQQPKNFIANKPLSKIKFHAIIKCFINDWFEDLFIRDISLITYRRIARFSIHRKTILINKKIYAKYNPFESVIEIEMKRKKKRS